MSHVDDGELTAYADGAYPVGDPDALRISAHLSACDNCRTRLEQAHAVRDRASEILGYATPAVRTAPAFEALEAQIATSSAKPRRHFNYAWAASIMLAIGLGWFGRGAWQNPPALREATRAVSATAPAQDIAAEEGAVAPPSEVPAPQVTTETRVAERPLARGRHVDALADRPANVEAKVGAAAGNIAVPTAPPPAAPAIAEADFAGEGAARTDYISAADAERRGLVYPRIPELPVARIGVVPGNTIVEQTLPDGKVIRLTVNENIITEAERRELRSAAAPARAASAEVAQAQKTRVPDVTVTRNNKLITVSGDLPADSLRALAHKIK